MINPKRIYEPADPQDGYRVLVERLWPRGISKQRAALDLWLKEIAPSPELRIWFGHDPRWEECRKRYREELLTNEEPVARLVELARRGNVTFVYAAKDSQHNAAVVLRESIEGWR